LIEMGGLSTFLPRLTLNCDPPDHSLPTGKDYGHESLVPIYFFLLFKIQLKGECWD
jgi:hypothetical protein